MPWEEGADPQWVEAGSLKGPKGDQGDAGPPGDEESLAAWLDQFQPKHAALTALSGLVSAADRLPYFNGAGTMALATLSAFGRTLLAAGSQAAARTALDVFSKAETTALVIPTAYMGHATLTGDTPVAGNDVLGGPAGYVPGLGCSITGDGRRALVLVHIASVVWSVANTTVYAYINQNDVLKTTAQEKGVPTTSPGNTISMAFLTDPLTAGQAYRFDVGLRTSGGSAGTVVAGTGYVSQIVAHRV